MLPSLPGVRFCRWAYLPAYCINFGRWILSAFCVFGAVEKVVLHEG